MASVPTKVLKVGGKFGSYGEDGATFTPHLKDDGENITISYTNNKGLDNPAPITFKKTALPKVTTADNGKILIAKNGEIVFAEISVDTPVFDLAALGLTAVPLSGGSSALETDTAAICAALDKGPVAFVIPFDVDGTAINATVVVNGINADGTYQCFANAYFDALYTLTVIIQSGLVMVGHQSTLYAIGIPAPTTDDNGKILKVVDGAYVLADAEDSRPTSIDLSAFESGGKIVETFADGSTATTVMEFDADGRPTKITDGSGNVTVLTW